ncbi:hypothetical protein EGW08_003383, partial [Elysia chlorotica]
RRHRKCKDRRTSARTQSDGGAAGLELDALEHDPAPQKPTRQRRSKGQVHALETEPSSEHTYMNVGQASQSAQSTAVKVEELKAYIQRHNSGSFLRKQYESVPMESKYSKLNALDPCNAKKNRYKNILPVDYTRVCLKVYGQYEDYINANHIKDHYNKKAYIAAQAPNDHTADDFVRMLWEQEVDRIIMLTNLVEGKKVKSVQYWPENGVKLYDQISMELLSTEIYAEYTVRR